MQPRDVVRFRRYEPPHHGVVLRVGASHVLIACSTSHARELDAVVVLPRTREAFSLGWGPHDDRSSYFYASGVHVVRPEELEPLPRRCHSDVYRRLELKAAEWAAAWSVAWIAAGETLVSGATTPAAATQEAPPSAVARMEKDLAGDPSPEKK